MRTLNSIEKILNESIGAVQLDIETNFKVKKVLCLHGDKKK